MTTSSALTIDAHGSPVVSRIGAVPATSRARRSPVAPLRSAWLDAASVLAPTSCAGCGGPDRSLCDRCRRALGGEPDVVDVGDGRVLRTWYSLRYQNTVRTVLVAFKDEGRTDVASALAEAMVPAVRAALRSIADGHTIRLATIPSTRAALRRRGYRPIELVLAHAGLQASRPLRAARQTADQAGLGLVERRTNRRESLSARRDVSGQTFLLIDDIVTTGATLREARRAIEAGGGRVIGAVAIAHTERRMPRS